MSRQNTWWIAILVMSALLVLLRIYLGLDYMTTEVENFPVRSKQF